MRFLWFRIELAELPRWFLRQLGLTKIRVPIGRPIIKVFGQPHHHHHR